MPRRDKVRAMEQQVESFTVPRPIIKPAHIWWAVLVLVSIGSGVAILLVNPMIVFGLLGVIAMAVFLVYYPFLGVLAYFVFEYARLSAMFPALQSLQIGKLIVLPTLAIWLVRYAVFRQSKVIYDRAYLFFFIWGGLAFASIAVALDTGGALDQSVDLVKWFIICFLIVNLVDNLKRFQWVMWIYLLLNFKLSQHQIRSFAAGYASATDREFYVSQGAGGGGGFFGNSTDFGLAMAIVAPLAFYLIQSVKSKMLKIAAGTFMMFFVVSILRSGSRGAALALFACGVLYWKYSKSKMISSIAIVMFIVGFWIIAPDAWKDRFTSAQNYEEDATASARIELWKGGWAMFADHPILGVGINNFSPSWVSKYRPGHITGGASVPHNIFIQAMSELGLGGLLVVIAIIYLAFRRNQETRRICKEARLEEPWILNFAYALDMSMLSFIVGGMFLTILYFPHLYVVLGLTIALNQIAKSSARDRQIPSQLQP
jgi:probable O-glycosylation ligase (exosortase A-associated)